MKQNDKVAHECKIDVIKETLEVWKSLSTTQLNKNDAIEIIHNTSSLFELLNELDSKYGEEIPQKS